VGSLVSLKKRGEKGRKDLEGMGERQYLCHPLKTKKSAVLLPGLTGTKKVFRSLVKVVPNGKINLVGMKKRLTLHSQSKNGSAKHSSYSSKKCDFGSEGS
jgi:hypothetical protein